MAEEAALPSLSSYDQGAGLQEVSIVTAIEEYLAYHELDEPLEAFRRDVARAELLRSPSLWSQTSRDVEAVQRA